MNGRNTPLLVGAILALTGGAVWLLRATSTPARTGERTDRGSIQVAVYEDGAPNPGRIVVFHDATGAILGTATTGADGTASGEVVRGGSVTVAYGISVQHLVTIVGVVPGERLVVGEAEDEGAAGRSVTSARVRLPGAAQGARRHAVSLGVGSIEVPDVDRPLPLPVLHRFIVDRDGGAPRAGLFRVLAEAFGTGGEPLAFSFAWIDSRASDAGAVDAALPPWRTTYRPVSIELVDTPPGPLDVVGHVAIVTGKGSRFERPVARARLGTPSGRATLRYPVPEPLVEDVAYRIDLAWEGTPDRAAIARRAGKTATDVRLDLGKELLPRVSAARVERTSDVARPRVRWTASGAGAAWDATVVQLAWPASRDHVWTIVAPPGIAPDVRPPALPPSLAAFRPDARAVIPAVALVESSEYDGFDDVRRKGIEAAGEAFLEDDDGSLRWSGTGEIDF